MELLWSILLCAYKAELTDKEKATWQKVNLVIFLAFFAYVQDVRNGKSDTFGNFH